MCVSMSSHICTYSTQYVLSSLSELSLMPLYFDKSFIFSKISDFDPFSIIPLISLKICCAFCFLISVGVLMNSCSIILLMVVDLSSLNEASFCFSSSLLNMMPCVMIALFSTSYASMYALTSFICPMIETSHVWLFLSCFVSSKKISIFLQLL